MDPLSAILFFIVGCCLVSLFRLFSASEKSTAATLAKYEHQLGRLVSDAESEKGTRRRVNLDLENRLRRLEGRTPIPHDHPEAQG